MKGPACDLEVPGEGVTLGVRVFLAVLGLFMLAMAVAFLQLLAGKAVGLASLLAGCLIALACAAAATCWYGALWGARSLVFDDQRRVLRVHRRGPFALRASTIPFEAVRSVEVLERTVVDDPSDYEVVLHFHDSRRRLQLGAVRTRAEADAWRASLLLGLGMRSAEHST